MSVIGLLRSVIMHYCRVSKIVFGMPILTPTRCPIPASLSTAIPMIYNTYPHISPTHSLHLNRDINSRLSEYPCGFITGDSRPYFYLINSTFTATIAAIYCPSKTFDNHIPTILPTTPPMEYPNHWCSELSELAILLITKYPSVAIAKSDTADWK